MSNSFKSTMREVMTLAWQFVRRNGYTMSEALKVAWRNIKLRAKLAKGITRFYFQKVDGSIREAFGTLASGLVPPTGDGRKANPTIQVYYDCERQGWRCFKRANLMTIA